MDSVFAQATALIDAASSVAVVGHVQPDADAMGSVCALVRVLQQRGKKAVGVIGQIDAFSTNLLSIPGSSAVACVDQLPVVDAAVVVDCASLQRTGTCAAGLEALADHLVVVDHHASNPGFGAINIVDAAAESTTTLLYDWFSYVDVAVDSDTATALYAGLVTDTGSFRWGRPRMHQLAMALMDAGADTHSVVTELMDRRGHSDLLLMGTVLSQAEVLEGRAVSVLAVVAKHELIAGMDPGVVESLVSFVQAPAAAEVGALLKEYEPDVWTVSLRSQLINVAEVAARLGGGGHVSAAGYTATGTFPQVKRGLVDALHGL